MTRIAGSTSAHLASKSQVLTSIKATEGVVFDWCSGLLANLKDQLTRCQEGRQKQFGYGSLHLSLFFLPEGASDEAVGHRSILHS